MNNKSRRNSWFENKLQTNKYDDMSYSEQPKRNLLSKNSSLTKRGSINTGTGQETFSSDNNIRKLEYKYTDSKYSKLDH